MLLARLSAGACEGGPTGSPCAQHAIAITNAWYFVSSNMVLPRLFEFMYDVCIIRRYDIVSLTKTQVSICFDVFLPFHFG